MGKLKNLNPNRVRTARLRVREPSQPNIGVFSETLAERFPMYRSRRWFALRQKMLDPECFRCGRPASTLDHLLGHDDAQAKLAAQKFGIPSAPDWRTRFWEGPFISLCTACHATKTKFERQGDLVTWLRQNTGTGQ